MNAFQKCSFTVDAVPLYLPQQLYLKPIAQITITVYLPKKLVGKVISNWELMEKLKSLITPDEFSVLKVSKNTIELIKFHAELEDKSKLNRVLTKLDNKLIKLKDFHELFKVRALEARIDFPNKHIWDSFFRDAKDMNEMKPGERPDTIHISNLPIRWFVPLYQLGEEDLKPSEKIFYHIFEKFGRIRHVDIPICDPYRNKMKSHISGLQTFSFDEKDFFEGYIQFKDYMGFSKAMDAFRGMKLLHKDNEVNETYMVNIKVDFDKTKHMSEASLKRREIVRERLIRKQKEKEEKEHMEKEEKLKKQEAERLKELNLKKEKEKRRREREEKRKAKILAQLKIKDADEINDKIAKEEKKLLKAQRKLEAIRLIEELFKRVKNKQENDLITFKSSKPNDELSKYKKSSEIEFKSRQNNLHHSIAGRVVLKTILSGKSKVKRDSSSSDTSLSLEDPEEEQKHVPGISKDYPLLYQYPPLQNSIYSYFPPVGPHIRGQSYFPYHSKGRSSFKRFGQSRGYRRGRGNYNSYYRSYKKNVYYPPELQVEYYRYFQKFLKDHDDRDGRSSSRSRSDSRSNDRKSRSRRRSYSKSRRSRSHSHSRSKSYSRTRTRTRSRSRQRSRRSSSSRRTRSSHRDRYKSRSRSRPKTKRKSKSPSINSVDSSKFLSPNRLRNQRSRSWSSTSNKNNKHC